MLFTAENRWWMQETGERFPRNRPPDETHPLFVLRRIQGMSTTICPCTSKPLTAARAIRQGCVFQDTGRILKKKTYLLEQFSLSLPEQMRFASWPQYLGQVPSTCLEAGS
ncbi:MAG: hypothetical protein EOM25_09365 [Deltaproteobacteria bacterium]|nr:hypothetical protein [Deltaproteobacteria bacterium]